MTSRRLLTRQELSRGVSLVVARLAGCAWPGNVRQLRNVVRQLVVDSRGAPLMRPVPKVARMLEKQASAP